MPTYDEIKQQIIGAGNNPDDFSISILSDGYKIEPKSSYEMREIVKQENITLLQENILLKAQSQANSDRADFQEEVLTEIIMTIMP